MQCSFAKILLGAVALSACLVLLVRNLGQTGGVLIGLKAIVALPSTRGSYQVPKDSYERTVQHQQTEEQQQQQQQQQLQQQDREQPPGCLKAPHCLEPSDACLPKSSRTLLQPLGDCPAVQNFCSRSVYELPRTKVRMVLPMFSNDELTMLYTKYYRRQSTSKNGRVKRPRRQALFLRRSSKMLGNRTGLVIMEMGCSFGNLLFALRRYAAQGGKLICYEADPSYSGPGGSTRKRLREAMQDTPGLSFEVVPSLMKWDAIPDASVDLFVSSHAVEHLADPCPWMEGLHRVLRVGGEVMTEVPQQLNHGDTGNFHMLFFRSLDSFKKMMAAGGFSYVASEKPWFAWRTLFRKAA